MKTIKVTRIIPGDELQLRDSHWYEVERVCYQKEWSETLRSFVQVSNVPEGFILKSKGHVFVGEVVKHRS